ncbi:hypothetical protein GLW20_09460, partial [Virgibacillus halodenitrificans]|nr:hypothetical protein [Virgibacillus halodenitrificans]
MSEVEILDSQQARLRLIDLEYKDLTDNELKKEIKKIYLEEYGELLNGKLEIFHSEDSKILENDVSGYDGTAIYVSTKDIDELYVISQGTTDIKDWEYNLKSMFAGLDTSQAIATKNFTEEARKHFGIDNTNNNASTSVIGLSHSLAHNNNTTAHLIYDTFDQIYSVNGAQTNFYQIYNEDKKFNKAVRENFSIPLSDFDAIYNLDPKQLETFAKEYYKDKATNVHQLISKDDPLYAVSGARGFFTIGDVKYVDTNPDLPGLRNLM